MVCMLNPFLVIVLLCCLSF